MTMYASYFFGFRPELYPIITFSKAGNRDALLRQVKPGEVIIYVGTLGEPTPDEQRGMVLGAAEIGVKSVRTEDVVDLSSVPASDYENGLHRWPEAIPMLRAWRFEPPQPAREFLKDRLRADAQVRAVPLSARDEAAVRALNWVEVALPEQAEHRRQRRLSRALAGAKSRPGPVARPGTSTVTRTVCASAWTYAMRFGNAPIWKIGRTSDLENRLEAVNKHVPVELLDDEWRIVLTHAWLTAEEAQAMEQRVLRRLETSRTRGERVRCSEQELEQAWIAATHQ